jgi:ribose-phosphate pyrophosphokinase
VPALAAAAKHVVSRDAVVVAPDLGAVKRAHAYGRLLSLPVAIVHKERLSGDAVTTHGIIGDVRGRPALVVDDMLSTGGTIEAAVTALRAAGAAEPSTVVVTHSLLVAGAWDRLARLPITCLITADTVQIDAKAGAGLMLDIVSTAPLIAAAIKRHHFDESLADLRASA